MQSPWFLILFIISALLLGVGAPLIFINYTAFGVALISVVGMLVFGNLWAFHQTWKIGVKISLCILVFLLTLAEFILVAFLMK